MRFSITGFQMIGLAMMITEQAKLALALAIKGEELRNDPENKELQKQVEDIKRAIEFYDKLRD